MKSNYHNFIIFDTETGGLSKKDGLHALNHPITSIALVGLDGRTLSEIDRYENFIKGKVAPTFLGDQLTEGGYVGYGELQNLVYQKEALRVTNISIEKLEAEGKDSKEVVNDIIKFFENCASGSNFHKLILVGHNVDYDIPFLSMLFKIHKKDLSKWLQGYYDHVGTFTPAKFCTMYLSRVKSIDSNLKHNLTATSEREGVLLVDAHSAMNDTIATAEVFKKYILLLRNSTSGEKQQLTEFRDDFKFEF